MQFYTKNKAGEVIPATNEQIEDFYKEKSGEIIAKKWADKKEKMTAQIRTEIEEQVRKDVSGKIEEEVRAKVEGELKPQIDEAVKAKNAAETQLRRKTIAAEYGLKQSAEEFLGDGSEEEMRKKADALKDAFSQSLEGVSFPKKTSTEPESRVAKETGLNIQI